MDKMSQDMRIETPLGAIIVRESRDPEHPGVWVDLRRTDADMDASLALIEYCKDEGDLNDAAIITRVWGDAMNDEYTERVVHTGVEQFFALV